MKGRTMAERFLAFNPHGTGIWEQIPQNVFEQRKYARSDDGEKPRYNEFFCVASDNGTILNMNLAGAQARLLVMLTRILGADKYNIGTQIMHEPATVKLNHHQTTYVVDCVTGDKFKLVKKA
jgi:hypothetical protein